MAIQLSTALRNARLDVIEPDGGAGGAILTIWTGAAPANPATANSGTKLCEMDLPDPWLNAASGGQVTKAGTWQDASADATGAAAHFRIHRAATPNDCMMQGTVTATGGGGDLELDNTSIASGQQVTVTTFTLTDGNA